MILQPVTWPEGQRPECDCSRRTDGALTSLPYTDGRCGRCYETVEWVDAEPERVEIPGQGTLL